MIVEVGRGGGQDAAVGFEHLSLDVDGEVAEAAVLSLPVEAAEHCSLSAGEAHLHHRAGRRVARGTAAAHFHVQRLHLVEGEGGHTSIIDTSLVINRTT